MELNKSKRVAIIIITLLLCCGFIALLIVTIIRNTNETDGGHKYNVDKAHVSVLMQWLPQPPQALKHTDNPIDLSYCTSIEHLRRLESAVARCPGQAIIHIPLMQEQYSRPAGFRLFKSVMQILEDIKRDKLYDGWYTPVVQGMGYHGTTEHSSNQ